MNKTSASKGTEIPYIRGVVPASLVVFIIASLPSVMGTFYFITNPGLRDIKYVFGLLVWIFLAYMSASISWVKISFLSNGIMIKDRIAWNVRRLFLSV